MFSNLKVFDKNDLEILEIDYKKFIRSKMELSKSRIDSAYLIYDDLFGNLFHHYSYQNFLKRQSLTAGWNQYFAVILTVLLMSLQPIMGSVHLR